MNLRLAKLRLFNSSDRARLLLLTLLAVAFATTPASASTSSTMYAGGPGQSGWYPNQPGLDPATVGSGTFGKMWTSETTGRLYGQPLVTDGLVLVGTSQNHVYGLNEETGAKTWTRTLAGSPWQSSDIGCGHEAMGVIGTGVVDTENHVWYFIDKEYVAGNTGTPRFEMHAVDDRTGVEKTGFPVEIGGVAQDNPAQTFNPLKQGQRPGLLLMNGVVYSAYAGLCDAAPYQGWVMGVSAVGSPEPAKIVTRWTDMRHGTDTGGGIWMSANGIASDREGDLLLMSGNGHALTGPPTPGSAAASGTFNLSEAAFRLHVNPDQTLTPTDFFVPYDSQQLDSNDADFGSGALAVLPSQLTAGTSFPDQGIAVGKEGYVYLMDLNNMGGLDQGPGGGDYDLARVGPYGGVWSRPSIWPGDGGWIWVPTAAGGEVAGKMNVYQYGVGGTGAPTLSLATQSSDSWGYGSSSPMISSNGTQSGSALVWANWAGGGAGAQLRAYLPVPQNGQLKLIFSAPVGGEIQKWSPPEIADNKVFVSNAYGIVQEFGSPVHPALTGTDLQFGSVTIGSTATQTATFTAHSTVTVSSANFDDAEWSAGTVSINGTPATLPAIMHEGDTLTVPVTFAPTHTGLDSDALSIGTTSANYALEATGTGRANAGQLTASTVQMSFDGASPGEQLTESVSYTNVGGAALTVTGVTLPGVPFSATGLPTINQVILPNQTITAQVTFSPSTVGNFESEIDVETTANDVEVDIDGTAAGPAQMVITPTELAFGSQPVGSVTTKTFTIKNTGGSVLTLNKAKPPSLGPFSSSDAPAEGTQIQPGQTLTLHVSFQPTSIGFTQDVFVLNGSDGGGVRNVTFTGTGTPSAAFATVNPGTGQLWVHGDDLNPNTIAVTDYEGYYGIQATGEDIAAQAGCTHVRFGTVSCTDPGNSTVTSLLMGGGSGNDYLAFDGGIPATINGYGGQDTLFGGYGINTLNAGGGTDLVISRDAAHDQIIAPSGVTPTVQTDVLRWQEALHIAAALVGTSAVSPGNATTISHNLSIPFTHITQLLPAMVSTGLLSTNGSGGYWLAQPATATTIYKVLQALSNLSAGLPAGTELVEWTGDPAALPPAWSGLGSHWSSASQTIGVDQLANPDWALGGGSAKAYASINATTGQLVVHGDSFNPNNIAVTDYNGYYAVQSNAGDIEAQAGCTHVRTGTVSCTDPSNTTVTNLLLSGGSGNDMLAFNGGVPATITGNGGRDMLFGGYGINTLNASSGTDLVISRDAAHDQIIAPSGVTPTVQSDVIRWQEALHATAALVGASAGSPGTATLISRADAIPITHLNPLLPVLAGAGVLSTNGSGGYWLAQPAAGTSLYTVLHAVSNTSAGLPAGTELVEWTGEAAALPPAWSGLGPHWSSASQTIMIDKLANDDWALPLS